MIIFKKVECGHLGRFNFKGSVNLMSLLFKVQIELYRLVDFIHENMILFHILKFLILSNMKIYKTVQYIGDTIHFPIKSHIKLQIIQVVKIE